MSQRSVTFFTDGSCRVAGNFPSTVNIELDAIHEQHRAQHFAEKKLFIANFYLLLRNCAAILASERYRNITFHGLAVDSAWFSRTRPLTVVELFYHYLQSDWVISDCCGLVYVISASGSPLSGGNQYEGYGSRPTFSELFNPYIKDIPNFPYVQTDCTVANLIADLREDG